MHRQMTEWTDCPPRPSGVGGPTTAVGIMLVLAMATACGTPTQLLGITDVSPHVAAAKHGTAQNTVQFTATGIYGDPYGYGSCCLSTKTVTDGQWATSDPVNTTINKSGLATCAGATITPAIITVTVKDDYGKFSDSAELVCQ